jgi:hypothetical protein
LAHSILTRASIPVAIIPLVQSQLRAMGCYTRTRGPTESTEFSLTRFLVPYLSGFRGVSVFMDCDMLCLADVAELLPARGAVSVCQHDYTPSTETKMEGQVQTAYPRKNWSSLMVFNNASCLTLQPDYINQATGLSLHRFHWKDDKAIGSLPLEWNWLVGEYEPNPNAKLLHYTLGGPWFSDYQGCDYADLWHAEYRAMTGPHATRAVAYAESAS